MTQNPVYPVHPVPLFLLCRQAHSLSESVVGISLFLRNILVSNGIMCLLCVKEKSYSLYSK